MTLAQTAKYIRYNQKLVFIKWLCYNWFYCTLLNRNTTYISWEAGILKLKCQEILGLCKMQRLYYILSVQLSKHCLCIHYNKWSLRLENFGLSLKTYNLKLLCLIHDVFTVKIKSYQYIYNNKQVLARRPKHEDAQNLRYQDNKNPHQESWNGRS